jgi:hypothetical protein
MRRYGILAAVTGALMLGWAAPPAQAQGSADLAIVHRYALNSSGVKVTSAQRGSVLRYVFIGKDLGPDALSNDSFDTSFGPPGFIKNATFRAEICAFGVSADTPSCEVGAVPVGQAVRTVVKVALTGAVGTNAKVRVCAFAENGTPDPNAANNCATAKVRITS